MKLQRTLEHLHSTAVQPAAVHSLLVPWCFSRMLCRHDEQPLKLTYKPYYLELHLYNAYYKCFIVHTQMVNKLPC